MSTRRSVMAGGAALMAATPWRAAAQGSYWPGADWETVTPQAGGFQAEALKTAVDAAIADGSVSVMVLKGGRIAAEAYGPGTTAASTREIASGAKSMVAVLVGAAIDAGKIKGVDQPAADFITPWKDTPKQAVTIRHMMSMTSGVSDEGLTARGVRGDQFAINAATPLIRPPGTAWAYNTPIFHLLYHLIARAAGERFEDFARRSLLGPLGMEHTTWVTSPGAGPSGPVTSYYTASCSARDLARFGLFAQRGGQWGDRRLVSEAYMKAATSPSQALNPAYGYLWWENAQPGFPAAGPPADGSRRLQFPGAPADTFAALGAGGQAVMVVPSLDLVVVRQGPMARGAGAPAALLARICAAAS